MDLVCLLLLTVIRIGVCSWEEQLGNLRLAVEMFMFVGLLQEL
jgi:hypothetical protein